MDLDAARARLGQALDSSDPAGAVHDLAKALKAEDMTQIALYRLYVEYQQKLDGTDPRYDAVVDTLDYIYGGPWAKGNQLFDRELTDEEVRERPTGE